MSEGKSGGDEEIDDGVIKYLLGDYKECDFYFEKSHEPLEGIKK